MAGLAATVPCFDQLLDSSQPKDTDVIIVEEDRSSAEHTSDVSNTDQEGAGRKRSRQETCSSRITLEAHWVVLYSLSSYFQAKLERWSRDDPASKRQRQQQEKERPPAADQPQQEEQQEAPPDPQQQQQQQEKQVQQQVVASHTYQHSLQLLVPPGQLELGRRLITAMYSSSPDLSDLEAPQLMQLAALAECYGVGKVVAAAAAQLNKMAVASMSLDIAAAVFQLPEACLSLEAFEPALKAAADKLQQELGDLEAVWGDQKKWDAVCSLPFGALLQLLRDERTHTADGSEDTALGTAASWMDEHSGDVAKAQQLLAVLRLPHCSVTYLTCETTREHLGEWGVSSREMYDLPALCTLTDEQRNSWLCKQVTHRKAWGLPRRPSSFVPQLSQDWKLPLADLRAAYDKSKDASGPPDASLLLRMDNPAIWRGRAWGFGAYVNAQGGFGLCLEVNVSRACVDIVVEMEPIPGQEDEALFWDPEGAYMAEGEHHFFQGAPGWYCAGHLRAAEAAAGGAAPDPRG